MSDKIEIKITNDKKEKYQSWEASVSNDGNGSEGHYSFDATAYGSTKKEAVSKLALELVKVISDIIQTARDITKEII